MSPHVALASAFLFTSNAHLVAIPATTAALHYLYLQNHLKKLTLYYDMQKLGRNDNYLATFDKVREILMNDERFSLYIEQNTDEKERNTTLIIENPEFAPFAFQV